ncbi:AAA family ATPase [Brevibacterium sp. S22]|uniref:ATP-binding protein n=1 Tax=Brevibacterium sp. S22 TaxID=2483794 RepID=UPI003211EE42
MAAIAIDGAKGVGKTATASERAKTVLTLDDPALQSTVGADPAASLTRNRPILFDEWQHVPQVWDAVRRAVDNDRAGGQFLFAGSASPSPGATSHSGAGRIIRLRMRPMTLQERGITVPSVSLSGLTAGDRREITGITDLRLKDYVDAIILSGFPGLQGLPARAFRVQLDSYIRNIVDRDIPESGTTVRRPDVLIDWLRAYAAATSTTSSYTQILNAATAGFTDKPSRNTTAAYRDLLSQIWVLDPVPAWTASGSELKRLQSGPKHHLADPALAARLLGMTRESLLDGKGTPVGPQAGTLLGSFFESLVTLCVRVPAQAAEAEVRHLRTRNGDHEIDLILVRPDGGILAFEVKLAATVTDSDVRHLHWLREQVGDRLIDSAVINTGPGAYRRSDGIAVIPLALLGA